MKKKHLMLVITIALALVNIFAFKPSMVYASDLDIDSRLQDVYEAYKDDKQFQLMREDYGDEYAINFLQDVFDMSNQVQTCGGGGNICYQYVTNIKQTADNNCGPTTTLQTLYGLGSASNVSGSTTAAKIATISNESQIATRGSMYVYEVVNSLNKYKPSGIGSYVYAVGTSMTLYGFESNIANSLTACKPVILHAKTGSLTYYGNKNIGHYLSVDYINRTTDMVRIVDCNNNDTYYGIHNVPLSEAYGTITSSSDRYLIY